MTQHTPTFPEQKGWKLSRLDGGTTPEESKEIEGMFAACLGLLHAGYSLKQATAFILAAPELLEALDKMLIEAAHDPCSISDETFGKAEAAIAKAGKGA